MSFGTISKPAKMEMDSTFDERKSQAPKSPSDGGIGLGNPNIRKPHPVASIFPLLMGEDYKEFKADVKERGLQEPILLHPNGTIIDGRNRYRACVELGIEPKFKIWEGGNYAALVNYVVSLNLKRRHLTPSQRAWIGQKVFDLLAKEAEKRQEASRAKPGEKIGEHKVVPNSAPPMNSGKARDQAAKIVGVGHTALDHAKTIAEKGAPELREAVHQGKIAVTVARELTALPSAKQAEVVAQGKKHAIEVAKELKQKRKSKPVEDNSQDQAIEDAVSKAIKARDDEFLDKALEIVEALRDNRGNLMAIKIKIESILIVY